jgi:hypothetical protein
MHRLLPLAALIAGLGCGRSSGTATTGTGGTGGAGGGAGGVTATGGATATGGNAATGGSAATGGTGGMSLERSPGTSTLRLKLATGTSYCDSGYSCGSPRHIVLRSLAGNFFSLTSFLDCAVRCDTCQKPPCPGIACLPGGWETHDEELVWDGNYDESSTCGAPVQQCRRQRFAPPGQYVAVMCATPGNLRQPDGGTNPVCEKTGDLQCVAVPFTFPSPTPVEGRLGMPGSLSCGKTACIDGEVCVNPCCGGAPQVCDPASDAGTCPSGAHPCVRPAGDYGCSFQCTPPLPFCQPASKPLPTGCSLGKDRQAICVCG